MGDREGAGGFMCGTDGCRPLSVEEAAALLQSARRTREERAAKMPTEEDAIRALFDAYERLRELGWREIAYAPKGGPFPLDVIEVGSTGIHKAWMLMLTAERPSYWIDNDWPSSPILYRATATKERAP